METHSKYGANIYYHNEHELYISQFIASEVQWEAKQVKIEQHTNFPEEQGTSIILSMQEPQQFSLNIRYPYWAESGIQILINGREQKIEAEPGSFIVIDREWKNNDQLEVKFPFSLRLEAMPDDANRVAVFYGPVVLAGDLGVVDDKQATESDFVPVFITQERDPVQWLEPVSGKANTFATKKVGHPRDIEFKPFYQTHDRRYSVYFDLFTEKGYEEHLADLEAEKQRQEELEAMTFDGFQPGDSLEEIAHRLQGEKLNIMQDFKGRKARGAERGGWLAFDMRVPQGQAMDLIIEYWGGFTGSKTFDILIDDQFIITENITGKKDGHFLNIFYPIPTTINSEKEQIRIKFAPHAGHRAGPFFYARTVPRDGI
jgi:hypothetical protein